MPSWNQKIEWKRQSEKPVKLSVDIKNSIANLNESLNSNQPSYAEAFKKNTTNQLQKIIRVAKLEEIQEEIESLKNIQKQKEEQKKRWFRIKPVWRNPRTNSKTEKEQKTAIWVSTSLIRLQ